MKISDRDKKLILFVLLVAVIALPIFLFIRPKNEKIKELDAQLVSINDRYNYLKELSEKQPEYEAKIAELNAERDKIIDDFPGGVLFENTVMFIRATELHFDKNFRATTMTFAEDEEETITEAKVNDNGEYVEGLTAVKATTTINYCGEYPEIKELLNYIFNQKDTMILSYVEMGLDPETNMIGGTIVLDQYAITGNGKEVKQTSIPSMEHGMTRLYDLILDEEGNVKTYWSSIGVKVDDAELTDDQGDDGEDL
jgi:hypothetical protein